MKNKYYITDSFYLTCYLMSESIRLIDTDGANPKRILFILEESEKRERLTQDFLSYKALSEPNRLFASFRNLKQVIFQIQKEGR